MRLPSIIILVLWPGAIFSQSDVLFAKDTFTSYQISAIGTQEGRLKIIYNGEEISVPFETVDSLKLKNGRVIIGNTLRDDMLFIDFPINNEGMVEYSGVERTDSVSATVLHQRAKFCMVELFNSFKDVVQNNDEAAALLMIKGYMVTSTSFLLAQYKVRIEFTLTMEFKSGRYRYSVKFWKFEISYDRITYYDFLFSNEAEPADTRYITRKMWRDIKTGTFTESQRFIQSMKKCMNTPKSDDW